jgi:hypothetical protein
MKYRVHASCSFSVALLLAALLSTCLQSKDGKPLEDNREVTQLLEDTKVQAADLQRDSDELESFSRSQVSWESHATELQAIKERIDKIGQTIQKYRACAVVLSRSNRKRWTALSRLRRSSLPIPRLRLNASIATPHICKTLSINSI